MATTQENRTLSIETPLGKDVFLLESFTGVEEMNRPFRFELETVSLESGVAPADLVGKEVGFFVQTGDGEKRPFHGFVSRMSAGLSDSKQLRRYRVEVVPWLWFLTRNSSCRIFQDKTTPEIVEQIFKDLGFDAYKLSLRGKYAKHVYCVQYRESDFDFVSRLLEDAGIYYFFEHAEKKHTLVLADDTTSYFDCKEKEVEFDQGTLTANHLTRWEHQYSFTSGKFKQRDYDFTDPSKKLESEASTVVDLPNVSKFGHYDYPGLFLESGDGDARTRVRMEEQEATHEVVQAGGTLVSFGVGGKFKLTRHDTRDEEGRVYVITSIRHAALDPSLSGASDSIPYTNTFQCIPEKTVFRPRRVTPRPRVHGPQTAVVVGPSGEEIDVDEHGRVKVQFHWDLEGKQDENSSCYIRVAQNMAGKKWGFQFLPRVGQEVVVSFLEGDPDKPLVTGAVYNGDLQPPYDLPAKKTQSGIKTRSTKSGGTEDFNELRFEDKKGEEQVYFHAQKDFERVVENDDLLDVQNDQTITVKNDRTETVSDGNEKVTIAKGKRDVIVSTGNDTHKIAKGKRTVEIGMGDDALTIKMGNRTTKLSLGKDKTEAMQGIELKVGGNSIKIDQTGITIKGIMVKVQGTAMLECKAPMSTVKGDGMLTLKGGLTMIN